MRILFIEEKLWTRRHVKVEFTADCRKCELPALLLNSYVLLDGLVCSIVGYFYESRRILASP